MTVSSTPRCRATAVVAALLTFLVVLVAPASAPAQAAVVHDGSSPARAAASCWEIKQEDSGATSGRYWLLTPTLQVPTQFTCDMTTDGGGWVLVGRGRTQWTSGGDGSGTTAQVETTTTGTTAFRARQLSDATIDGLLDGGRVDALPDGIRLRRAADRTGSTWQEVRIGLTSTDHWSWALDGGLKVSRYSVQQPGAAVRAATTAQTTASMTLGDGTTQVISGAVADNAYVHGFGYGATGPTGTTASTSYLYSSVAGGKYAVPFTQVWLRPELKTSDLTFPSTPAAGLPAQTAPAIPSSGAITPAWGVTGLGAGGTDQYAPEVSAMVELNGVVYVGGNFVRLEKNGTSKVAQSYLAAFNATTGSRITTFKPTLNNQVTALAVLPGGRLAVGGEFTKVNGRARQGLVALYPTSGATYGPFTAEIDEQKATAHQWVRTLQTVGKQLYVGGEFTRVRGGTSTTWHLFSNILRVSATTGAPDTTWRPNLGTGALLSNGKHSAATSVLSLNVSADHTTVYAVGRFQEGYVGDDGRTATSQQTMAAITTATPASFKPWKRVFSSATATSHFQQVVERVGDIVWVGGSQHSMFGYDASTLTLVHKNLTLTGGDIQAITSDDGVVYAGCHCNGWNYSGTQDFDHRAADATEVDGIGWSGAWDADTGDYLPAFKPDATTRGGNGPWSLLVAGGSLWAAGTYTSVVGTDGVRHWAGGFVRYPIRPHTAPAAPSGLQVQRGASSLVASWKASATAGVTYEVLLDGRVVATTTGTSATLALADLDDPTGDLVVRASDGQGNRSASTPVVHAPAPSSPVTLVSAGSSWAYWFDASTPVPDGWTSPTYNAASWTYGTAPLGWGSGVTTSIDTATTAQRALTAYFRRTFQVADPTALTDVVVHTRADDGAVVYVNGTEVGRRNLPTGTITASTYATAAPSTKAATATSWDVAVPSSLLRSGTNVVSVEVHANYRATPDLSHDLSITATQE